MAWPGTVMSACTCLALLGARPALAWQQAHTKSGCGERWLATHLGIKVEKRGLDGIADADYLTTVQQSTEQWQAVTCGVCASAGANQAPFPCKAHPLGVTFDGFGFDHTTTLGPDCVESDASGKCKGWKPNGNFVVAFQSGWPFGASVVSITVATTNLATGEIVDADVGLDDADNDFCVGNCKPSQIDLCSALTHEFGHVLGMEHSSDPEATMFATATAGEKKKCSLTADDANGICAMYASTCDPATVAGTADAAGDSAGGGTSGGGGGGSGSTCSAARTSRSGPWWLAVPVACLWWRRKT